VHRLTVTLNKKSKFGYARGSKLLAMCPFSISIDEGVPLKQCFSVKIFHTVAGHTDNPE